MFGEELDLNTSILLFCRLSFIIIAHFYSNFKIPMNDIFDNNFCKMSAKNAKICNFAKNECTSFVEVSNCITTRIDIRSNASGIIIVIYRFLLYILFKK